MRKWNTSGFDTTCSSKKYNTRYNTIHSDCCCAVAASAARVYFLPYDSMGRVSIDTTGASCAINTCVVLCGVRVAPSHVSEPQSTILTRVLRGPLATAANANGAQSSSDSSSRQTKSEKHNS